MWVLNLKLTGPVPTNSYPKCLCIKFWRFMIGGGGGKSHLYLHFTSYLKLIFSYVTKEFTYEMERLTDIENRLWFKGKGMEEG